MKIQKKLGLIGKDISYSFSKKYFEDKFKKLMKENYSYSVFDISEIAKIHDIFLLNDLMGLNVTIPYKEAIIPYLDRLSEEARNIGAVNTIKIINGEKIGYNTDAFGFEKCLKIFLQPHHQSAIILGDGGAAKAVQYVFKQNNIPFLIASRKTGLPLEELTKEIVSQNKIIVQCTPVGTFPNIDQCIDFPFDGLCNQHLLIDLIYNPSMTKFLKAGQEKGAKTINGLLMLEQQAEKAWEIWENDEN